MPAAKRLLFGGPWVSSSPRASTLATLWRVFGSPSTAGEAGHEGSRCQKQYPKQPVCSLHEVQH